jgi:hypothetical protein
VELLLKSGHNCSVFPNHSATNFSQTETPVL